MNKKIILILVVLTVAVGSYFLLQSKNVSAPVITDTPMDPDNIDYVGLTVAEAEAIATTNDTRFRVVALDGELQPTTLDFQVGRINAMVENGVVTSFLVESMTPTMEPPTAPPPGTIGNPTYADNAMEGDMVDLQNPSGEPTVNMHDEIIGMTTAQAEAYVQAKAVDFRIGAIDGEVMPVTMDYRVGRITAEIDSGVVTGYTVEQ